MSNVPGIPAVPDFLGRLAVRALRHVPVVLPRTPSRFETAPVMEEMTEEVMEEAGGSVGERGEDMEAPSHASAADPREVVNRNRGDAAEARPGFQSRAEKRPEPFRDVLQGPAQADADSRGVVNRKDGRVAEESLHPRPSSPRPSSPDPSQPPSPGEEGERPLITPTLFSHRPPPNRETRGNSKTAPTGFPSPAGGGWEASGEGTGVKALGRGRPEEKSAARPLAPLSAAPLPAFRPPQPGRREQGDRDEPASESAPPGPPPRLLELEEEGPGVARIAPGSLSPRAVFREEPLPLPAAEPVVRVTIGRIEVKAVSPPPPRPPAARTAGPQLSLEEYLRRRSEGRM